MPNEKPIVRPTVKSVASYVKKNAAVVRKAQRHMHMSSSVREADYKGHHIVIRTTYDIRVDGSPIMGHLGVSDDGRVHYHPVPNVSFGSAIDMVKQIIDAFPDDFAGRKPQRRDGGGGNMNHMRHARKAAGRRRR